MRLNGGLLIDRWPQCVPHTLCDFYSRLLFLACPSQSNPQYIGRVRDFGNVKFHTEYEKIKRKLPIFWKFYSYFKNFKELRGRGGRLFIEEKSLYLNYIKIDYGIYYTYDRSVEFIAGISDQPFVAVEPKKIIYFIAGFSVELFRDEIDRRSIAFCV